MRIGRWSGLFILLSLVATAGIASAQQTYPWVGPQTAPPPAASSRNVPAPVNVGSSPQTKAGWLGIAVSNDPQFPLDVNGSVIFNGSLILYNTPVGTNNRYLNFGPNSGGAGYGFWDNAGQMYFKNNGGTWTSLASAGVWATSGANIYNTNTGNVGISNGLPFTPGQKLHVVGNVQTEGLNPRYILRSTDANTSDRITDISGTGASAVWRFYKQLKGAGTDTTLVYMNILSNGNVGIGTAAPSEKLHVNGNIKTNSIRMGDYGGLALTDGAGRINLYSSAWGGATPVYLAAEPANKLTVSTSGFQFFTAPAGAIGAAVTWTPRMLISTGGGVGVGNTAPAASTLSVGTAAAPYQLCLNGVCISTFTVGTNYWSLANGHLSTAAAVTGIVNTLGRDVNGYGLGVPNGGIWANGTNVNGDSIAATGGINANGNIKTSSNLIVNTSAGDPGVFIKKGDSSGAAGTSFALINTGIAGTNRLAIGPSTGTGGLTGFSERVSILNNGNVGIGTASPGKKLDVEGSAVFGAGAYTSGAVVGIGSAVVDYPGNAGWPATLNSNVLLSGLDYTSIAFHDSANTVGILGHVANTFFFDGGQSWGPISLGLNTRAPAGTLHIDNPAHNATICLNTGAGSCISSWPSGGGGISGTAGRIPRFATATTLGDSSITSDGVSSTANGNFFVTGDLTMQGGKVIFRAGNEMQPGTGDGATYSTYNIALRGWWGMAFKDHLNTVRGVYDFRTGNFTTDGAITMKAQGSRLGTAIGNKNAPTTGNTNILLYNYSGTNWSGIGSHTDGSMYFVTGTVAPTTRMSIAATGEVSIAGNLGSSGNVSATGNIYSTGDELYSTASGVTSFGQTKLFTWGLGNVGGCTVTNCGNDIYIEPQPGRYVTITPFGAGVAHLVVNGNAHIYDNAYADAFIYSSDERLKKSIAPLVGNLHKVLRLKPVTYLWKDTSKYPEGTQLGFIAQDVEKIVPEVVHTDDDGMKAIDYVRLTPLLVGSVQELNEKVEYQQRQIDDLRAQIEALREK